MAHGFGRAARRPDPCPVHFLFQRIVVHQILSSMFSLPAFHSFRDIYYDVT